MKTPASQDPTTVPPWRLPVGVSRSLWQYAHSDLVAEEYDKYFALNRLFDFDEQLLAKHFVRPGRLVDLGCGTGRLLAAFARRGFRTIGVDLSAKMLRIVGEKAELENLRIDRVQANIVELGCLRSGSADYVISMFSTLGMIHGRENRQRALAHARRLLKPDGRFAVHVHNVWFNLYDPQGRWWLLGSLFRSLLPGAAPLGDKVFFYRGIPNMYLHVFRRRELVRELRLAGLEPIEVVPLDAARHGRLAYPWFLGDFRANGWIAVCRPV